MAIADPRRLVGVISGMIIWVLWFIVVYGLTGVGCKAGWNTLLPVGNLLSLLMLLSAVLALALIGWCARRGYVSWRAARASRSPDLAANQRQRFMGLAMFMVSLLAGLGTVMITLPILMLDPCAS